MTRAVDRAAAILLAVGGARHPLRLGELADATGLDPATTLRIATTLVARGLIDRDPSTSRFSLGLGMLDLATGFFERSDARALSRPVLKELARRTPFHVRLEVLSGFSRVIAIEEHEAPAPRPPGVIGHVAPLHAGSGGLAILAFVRGPVFNRVMAGPMEAFTPRTITSALRLRRELAVVRGGHVSYTEDQAGPGAHGLSAPILDAAGHAEASLTLVAASGAPCSGDLPEHTAALLESAERLSRILRSSGHSPQELLVPTARLRVPA